MKQHLIYIVLCLFISCSAQKKLINVKIIQHAKIDTSLVEKILFPIRINDYNLEDEIAKLKITVTEEGLYKYKDSTLVNASTKIYLHKFSKIEKNKIQDCEKPPVFYGYLEGNIINGRKEGKWLKKIKTLKRPHYIIVKIYHYKNGVLDGKYQIYDTNGTALVPTEPHPLFPDEHKDYETFTNGTGLYYDYYYETKTLKVQGYYKNNRKNGTWIYYNKSGNEIMREYYKNQILINE